MEQFFDFIAHHPILFLLFSGLLFVFVLNEWRQWTPGIQKLAPLFAVQLINQKDVLILDLRSQAEFEKGSLIHTEHLSLQNLERELARLTRNKEKPILLITDMGQSLKEATQLLKKAGQTELYTISGGLEAWQNAQLPLVKKS
ncbi:MAG: rhodanese-like domain-containing protein [Gammaproteobacteria bacterium]|nr:rhodanese-like domain-containing protein [Gammaproteobacteria bacterium]